MTHNNQQKVGAMRNKVVVISVVATIAAAVSAILFIIFKRKKGVVDKLEGINKNTVVV